MSNMSYREKRVFIIAGIIIFVYTYINRWFMSSLLGYASAAYLVPYLIKRCILKDWDYIAHNGKSVEYRGKKYIFKK